MARKVTAMEAKLLAAVFTGAGGAVNVSEVCRMLGISRQTFYKYRRRWEAEGPPGLVERSRRPLRSPGLMSSAVEEEIVRLRKELPLDNGAQTIAYHLQRAGWPTPSVSAIHRALVRRGLVVPQPQKRPRCAWRRFQWPRPNDAWQIDATCWALASGTEVWVMDVLDDHSRLITAARVCAGPTSAAVWEAWCAATSRWGLPARVMSDNGTCFTGRFNGGEVHFERDLRALGIRHLRSSPGHPQTCGKLERFHQTLKRWLRLQPLAVDHGELQGQLDTFIAFYNHHRPHRALAGATPAERWAAQPPAGPSEPTPAPPKASLVTVNTGGHICWGARHTIGLGRKYAGQRVLVISRDHDVAVFGASGLIRRLQIDPTRRFQPTGTPTSRPRNTTGPRS